MSAPTSLIKNAVMKAKSIQSRKQCKKGHQEELIHTNIFITVQYKTILKYEEKPQTKDYTSV